MNVENDTTHHRFLARLPEGEGEFQLLQAILTVAAGAIDVGVNPLGRLPEIRDDKARVIAGSRPWCHTTSALMIVRRAAGQVPA